MEWTMEHARFFPRREKAILRATRLAEKASLMGGILSRDETLCPKQAADIPVLPELVMHPVVAEFSLAPCAPSRESSRRHGI